MRCFVAVAPGERLRDALSTRLDAWRGRWDLAWVRDSNLHVTLRFLGEWPADRVEPLREALADVAAAWPASSLAPDGLDVFPHWRAPRVLFLQFRAADRLAELAAAVNAAVDARCPGLGKPAGSFRAHLTLARIKRPLPPSDRDALRRLDPGALPELPVDALRLIESRLRPRGPEYADLAVFPLAGAD